MLIDEIQKPINKTKPTKKNNFDYSLEALRGVAALFVILDHAIINGPTPDPHPHVSGIWQYAAPGHLSVIVFFMLSGYVIGLTNTKPLTKKSEIGSYLKKRFVRLYPLYLLSILVTVLVANLYHTPYSLGTIGGFLTFLQGLVVEIPDFNRPVWSLGYEIAYYLIFILVSAKQWRAQWVALFFLALGLVLSTIQVQPIVLVAYAYGAVFWFLGMFLTKLPKAEKPLEFGTMLAFLMLMLSYERMNLLHSIMQSARLDVDAIIAPVFSDRMLVFSDLSYLVVCVPVLLCFTNRSAPGRKWLEVLAFAMPGFYLAAYLLYGKINQIELFNTVFLAGVFYILAVLLYVKRKSLTLFGNKIIQALVPLGGISYGIYIIHYPILFVFHQLTGFSGTVVAFLTRLVIYLATVLVLGWLLEMRLQPLIRKKLT